MRTIWTFLLCAGIVVIVLTSVSLSPEVRYDMGEMNEPGVVAPATDRTQTNPASKRTIRVYWNHPVNEVPIIVKILEHRSPYTFERVRSEDEADLFFFGVKNFAEEVRRAVMIQSNAIVVFWSGESSLLPKGSVYPEEKLVVHLISGHQHTIEPDASDQAYARLPHAFLKLFSPETCWFKDTKFLEASDPAERMREWRNRPMNAAFFARHLPFPRQEMVDFGSQVLGHVHCGGKALNNIGGLEKLSKDAYFLKSKFAICPENKPGPGYVTENIYAAFLAGAVPLYWPLQNPEPKIFNPERIVHFDPQNTGAAKNRIMDLMTVDDIALRFFAKPILAPGAKEYAQSVCDNFAHEVVGRLEELMRRKDEQQAKSQSYRRKLWRR